MTTVLLIFNHPQIDNGHFEISQVENLISFCRDNDIEIAEMFSLSNLSEMMNYITKNKEDIDMLLYDLGASLVEADLHYGCWLNDLLCYNLNKYNISIFNDCDYIQHDSLKTRFNVQLKYNQDNLMNITTHIIRSDLPLAPVIYLRNYVGLNDFSVVQQSIHAYCYEKEMNFQILVEEETAVKTSAFELIKNNTDSLKAHDETMPFLLLTNNPEFINDLVEIKRFYRLGIREVIFFFSKVTSNNSLYAFNYTLTCNDEKSIKIEYISMSYDIPKYILKLIK